jgi:flagellar basal body rod protein FlgG
VIYGLYQSAAGMMTHEYRQDVIANNLANAETAGFKREIAIAAEREPASRAGVRRGPSDELLRTLTGGVWLARTETDFGEGAMEQTGGPLDVALAGPGFFRVQKAGATYLTRDGRFTTQPDGSVVSVTDGAQVLGAGGIPLRLNPRGGPPTIDEIGRVFQNRIEVGRLSVVDVDDYHELQKTDSSRFRAAGVAMTDTAALVQQGYVERAGVEPVKELVSMLESTRAYQLNAQMLTMQDQTAGRLIAAVTG